MIVESVVSLRLVAGLVLGLVVVPLCGGGCEAPAQESHGPGSARLSVSGESCAAAAHCAPGLRCIDRICQNATRSDLGDYYLMAGQLALSQNKPQDAIKSLRAAEAEYKRISTEPPVDVTCQLGEALATMANDVLKAEEAAAKLHRCVRQTSGGSAVRWQALRALATLAKVGFDPVHLASNEAADRYLTAAAERPNSDSLKLTVRSDQAHKRKTYLQWLDILASAEARAVIKPCWSEFWNQTKQKELVVKIPYHYYFRLDPDYESRDRGVLTAKLPSNAPPTVTCVANALKPLADAMAQKGGEYSWKSTLSIEIKP